VRWCVQLGLLFSAAAIFAPGRCGARRRCPDPTVHRAGPRLHEGGHKHRGDPPPAQRQRGRARIRRMDKLRYPSAAHARPRRTALAVVALLAGAIGLGPGLWPGPARADDDPLARIRRLEGTWLVVDASGQPTDQVASVFRVTANGHSVEEVMFPGS